MYRTVETGMWDDPKFRSLPPLGKLLFTFLFTNRVGHVSGIYPLPRVMMTYGTGIDGPTVDTLCDTLSRLGLAHFDPALDLVFVVSMLKHQGRGEKNERSAAAHLSTLHNSFLVREFLSLYPSVSKYVPDTLLDRVSEVRFPARAEQDQEQELEQEKEKRGAAPASGAPLPTAKPEKPKRPPRFDPRTVPLPAELDSPTFRAVWEERIVERGEPGAKGGAPAESQIRAQLKKLVKLTRARGLPVAVACVERAIEGRHQGIVFEEDFEEPRRNGYGLPLTPPRPPEPPLTLAQIHDRALTRVQTAMREKKFDRERAQELYEEIAGLREPAAVREFLQRLELPPIKELGA